MVVEDEWLQAENLETLLELRGHILCGIASTGEQAVELAKSARPDIVTMDVKLSGRIDGVEAAARIVAALPDCGVIFVTAFDDKASVERMERLHPYAILKKPAREADLIAAVTRATPRWKGP